ncbi:UNVERIFIED_CONTAM: hypothetical protein K2H54_055076 [Gekko kuhli]
MVTAALSQLPPGTFLLLTPPHLHIPWKPGLRLVAVEVLGWPVAVAAQVLHWQWLQARKCWAGQWRWCWPGQRQQRRHPATGGQAIGLAAGSKLLAQPPLAEEVLSLLPPMQEIQSWLLAKAEALALMMVAEEEVQGHAAVVCRVHCLTNNGLCSLV